MATNNQKTDLLFKQFTGVVNASQLDPFSNSNSNKFPFQPYILGQDVLIEIIPNDLSNIWELIETFYGVNVDDRLTPLAMNGDGKTLAMAIQKHDTPAVSDAGKINIYSAVY